MLVLGQAFALSQGKKSYRRSHSAGIAQDPVMRSIATLVSGHHRLVGGASMVSALKKEPGLPISCVSNISGYRCHIYQRSGRQKGHTDRQESE